MWQSTGATVRRLLVVSRQCGAMDVPSAFCPWQAAHPLAMNRAWPGESATAMAAVGDTAAAVDSVGSAVGPPASSVEYPPANNTRTATEPIISAVRFLLTFIALIHPSPCYMSQGRLKLVFPGYQQALLLGHLHGEIEPVDLQG